ncbi:hypothetical protein KI387_030930, partial [Taxus chinensis]
MSRKRAADSPLVLNNMDAKHASLLQEFLQLQNEFAALKDRLQVADMRKTTVQVEVRFLRRRLKKLKEFPTGLKAKDSTPTIEHCDSKTAFAEKSTSNLPLKN